MQTDTFMNMCECEILKTLSKVSYDNQRDLADRTGYSVGAVNRSLKLLCQNGYLSGDMRLTEKAASVLAKRAPKRAIILAAGYGMRMVPINMESSKAFLEINGEPLIERQIRQLHDAGVNEIYIVVGFMKERFEYLIDEYGVELIVNPEYSAKNNLHSLYRARKHMDNCYIVPCDIWCADNPFSDTELYSWYMVGDNENEESTVRVNRKMELVQVAQHSGGNAMIGISYLTGDAAETVRARVEHMAKDERYDNAFWEEALINGDRMIVNARIVPNERVSEINTYEQLREIDSNSKHLRSDAIELISDIFKVDEEQIQQIDVLKKGMTNRSFLFMCKGRKYIMRIPGEGTNQLINRPQEAAVYREIAGKELCDDPVYINPDNGYKITEYIENVRTCDPENEDDLRVCMTKLRQFHDMKLTVEHEFDIFERIEFYESLWGGAPSLYKDYSVTKKNVYELREYIAAHAESKVLTHIDAVPDNFLFDPTGKVQLTDWEYAGMQDPHVDIAMFCIYAMYNREQIDHLIDLYFTEGCKDATRIKIYCYIAACGLLWSNWCEYKHNLGVEFGEYSLRQYRYAKEYCKLAKRIINESEQH